MKKRIVLILFLGIMLLISGCGNSDKIETFKNTPVIELEYGSVDSVFNYESVGTVDEFAEVYIGRLGLNKNDFKIKVKEIISNEIYELVYKHKKEEIGFTIYFDKQGYAYAPTFIIESNNKDNYKETLQYMTGI